MNRAQKTVSGCQRLLAEKGDENENEGDYEDENVTTMVDDDFDDFDEGYDDDCDHFYDDDLYLIMMTLGREASRP